MKTKLLSLFSFIFCFGFITAQETITFSGYDGSGWTMTASTATVNDNITIVFEDSDIVNNFYTDFQDNVYMYGGLDTDNGGWQGTPDFGQQLTHPVLTLTDSNNNAAPNTYSITINLAQHYTAVADGTMVYGFNFLLQNQYGGNGNNQTADFYIDLVDAQKDATLSIPDASKNISLKYVNNELIVNNINGKGQIEIYNLYGQSVIDTISFDGINSLRQHIDLPKNQIYIVAVTHNNTKSLLKVLNY
ncbi:MAG TPA: hypothetical protein VKZ97_06670 [Flavobacteriaceae bacterium]|nr:hypothetical protein [Flavobacteriaceae bacterium]